LGFQIVGEAEDGEAALEMAGELNPRLMILDINMPFINGLELAEIIRQDYPLIHIIILTGYEDFQYARKAIRTGVLNYVLKPINPEEMSEILQSARKKILIEERNRLVSLQGKVTQGAPVPRQLKERFLHTLISPDTPQTDGDILDRFRFFHLSLKSGLFVVCLIDGILPDSFTEKLPLEGYEVFSDFRGHTVLLTNEDSRISRLKSQAYYSLIMELLAESKKSANDMTIGISHAVDAPGDIPEACKTAEQALNEQYFRGKNQIFTF
jgi:two-component system response regulator YesN